MSIQIAWCTIPITYHNVQKLPIGDEIDHSVVTGSSVTDKRDLYKTNCERPREPGAFRGPQNRERGASSLGDQRRRRLSTSRSNSFALFSPVSLNPKGGAVLIPSPHTRCARRSTSRSDRGVAASTDDLGPASPPPRPARLLSLPSPSELDWTEWSLNDGRGRPSAGTASASRPAPPAYVRQESRASSLFPTGKRARPSSGSRAQSRPVSAYHRCAALGSAETHDGSAPFFLVIDVVVLVSAAAPTTGSPNPSGPGEGGGSAGAGTGGEEVEALQLSTRWLEVLRTYLELVLCVLVSIRNNRNLQKFSLFGDISILQQQGSLSNTYLSKVDPDGKKIKQIQQLFEEILSNSRQLKWLSCGFMLEIVTPTSLSSLSNSIANTMEHLSLLDNNTPGSSTLITAAELERFVNLRSLALDFCDFTAEMARVLTDNNHVPLQRLSLLVHNVSVMHKSLDNMPNDEHWKALSRKSTSLRVYIMAFDIKSEDMLKILKPSIPLERIHFDSYITCVSGAIVDLISRQYDKFLTHFILMNDMIDTSGFPDLSDNRNEDPLVLLAWRCTKLSLLAIHGYTVWAHNLIAIARLRGSDLKVLEVTEESIDFDQGELADQDVDPVHNLIEQVSLGLGQPWHAVMDIESLSVFTEPNRHFYREMQSFSEDV
nr:PREDICTED: F-box only protein 33 [Bos mutus]